MIKKTIVVGITVFLFTVFSFAVFGSNPASADLQAEQAAYDRNVDVQVQELEQKISDTKEAQRQASVEADQKIREYEDRIAEIKREAEAKLSEINARNQELEEREKVGGLSKIRRNFNEWRLQRSITGYENKIAALKAEAQNEPDAVKKGELEAKIRELETKNNSAKAKFDDLKTTYGENWQNIEQELKVSLQEIDQDYRQVKGTL